MDDHEIVKWSPTYSIGIRIVDEQHQGLIRLTNELFISCLKGGEVANARFLKTIRETVQYVQFHFATEEAIQKRVHYPDYAAHKKEHESFVKEVLLSVAEFNSGKKFLPNKFAKYLRDWVLTHIAVSDKKLGDYIQTLREKASRSGQGAKAPVRAGN
ncbi:hemerythrin family protein [Treponema primitia ZAS-2]|uniref:Hemerythrin family protein n=1 Tax=Treponema primitia (strain ATCC BAA-887 / DSM 12427 / ZAS-2) TaxID=545694 RepID=F5YPR9_TREPZ|nr:bacteriohemerythrin [Treponema primitia]AEF86195.1 hemerythrin family protein [Treponema primitia ZAS-2]